MPQYKVQIPGQGTFNVESPTELTDEQAYMAALQEAQPKPKAPEEKPDTGFTGAFKQGLAGAKGSGALLAGKLGLMDLAAAEKYNKEQEEYGKKVFAPTQESWGQAPFTHLKELAGGSLPYMAAPVIGGLLAPEATLGAGLASALQFTGTNLGRQVEEGKSLKDASLGAAALAAVPQAALDVMSLKMLPGVRQLFGKAGIDLTEKMAADVAKSGLMNTLGSYAAATGKAAGMEGLTEAAQQVFERLQAGLSLTDPAAREEYLQNFIGGAALGGALAPVGHAFERAGQRPQTTPPTPPTPPTPGAQPQTQQPVPAPEAAPIAEPTLRGEEPAPETPETIAAGPTKAAQRKALADQNAYLKQYEKLQKQREEEAAEYERIKAMSPEEYALEQMQGRGKTTKNKYDPAAQAALDAQLAELGYKNPAEPQKPESEYAAKQMALVKDRELQPNLNTYADYLLADPQAAAKLVANKTLIPGLPEAQSYAVLNILNKRLQKTAQDEAAQIQERQTSAQDRARSLFEQQGKDQTTDLLAGAREQVGNTTVRPEVQALRRIGERSPTYLTTNRDIEAKRAEEELIGKLVDTLPQTNGKVSPGDVYLGLGTKKRDVRDLQVQLAVARLTGNRTLQEDIKRQLDTKREIPTEGGLGTEGGKYAAEFISRSKVPALREGEAEGDKFAAEQRSTLLGMARLLNSSKLMLPAKRAALLSEAKETYVAQHAAEIEARRKAFDLPPMADWERAEARARALEGLNTLTNNWGRFEDPVISVKALQNITREAVYQNLYKAAQRRTGTEQTSFEEKTKRPTMGPRIAAPDELTLKNKPNIAATDAGAAQQFIEQVLSQIETKGRTRVEPTTEKKPPKQVGDMASLAALFKKAETGGRTAEIDDATVSLLENLREQLRTNNDPEFVSLARETAQKVAEGNLPNAFDVRDLGEMMKAHEVAGRSETRPGATPEDLQRTSAQPQKELFPEAAVQIQRANPANFQKMLDSKNVQGMRDALAKQRADNIAALQSMGKALPTLKNRLAKAQEKYKRTQKRAEAAGTEASNYVSEYKTELQDAQDLVVILRDELVQLENQLKDVELTKEVLSKEPTDMRFLVNAPKMLATEKPLRSGIKLLESEITNAQNLIASIQASYQAQQTLVVPAQKRAEKTGKQLEQAQAELSKVKNEANAAAKRAERLEQADKEAKAKAEADIGTPKEVFEAAAQAGREGLNLPGIRLEKDTTRMKQTIAQMRRAMGSLDEQIANEKDETKLAELKASRAEYERKLETVYADAPVVKTVLQSKAAEKNEKEYEDAQKAAFDQKMAKRRKRAGEKAPRLEKIEQVPVYRSAKTTRIVQPYRTARIAETASAITDRLITARSDLTEVNRRIDFLRANGKDKVKNRLTDTFKKLQEEQTKLKERIESLDARQKRIIALEDKAEYETPRAKEIREAKEVNAENNRFARGVETTSPDLTVSQVKALEDNDIRQAMNDIAADGNTSKLNQVVAQRLAAMLDNTDVKIERSLTDEDGKSVLGMATSKLVQLNRNGGLSQEILLHEGTHAATERVIVQYEKDPTKLTEIQRVAVRELKALHAAIKNDPRVTSASAKGSLSEFVAEVFSNKNLQNQLSQKKWRLSDAWKGFKSIIMRMLGVENPETMLGAALQSIDALMVPSSDRTVGGKETAVSRRLSAKDIAALHTGSNSMKQFAEQFGTTAIKQKDRTVEDANRIGLDYLDDMYANPMDYVAPAEPNKLDYKAIMPDGKEYDEENTLHYIQAEAATFANIQAQENEALRQKEAASISAQRKKDLRALVRNMMETPEFTNVEQALVAKAASKFAVLSDKSGKLKLAAIEPNNRHSIAVVSSKDAGFVIEELRAGKPLKQAFLEGMQKNADENAKNNERKNGWQKFEQVTASKELNTSGEREPGRAPRKYKPSADLEQAAINLNAACAGTPWCTGAGVATARSQIQNGDFYVYFDKGRPEVAVRMDGQDKIGEIRGNSPDQAISAKQQTIAKSFLQEQDFKGSDKYISQFERKQILERLVKNDPNLHPVELLLLGDYAGRGGEFTYSDMAALLDFGVVDGYGNRPKPSEAVFVDLINIITQRTEEAFDMGVLPGVRGSFNYPGTEIEFEFNGKEYAIPLDNVQGIAGLDVYANNKVTLPNLVAANQVVIYDKAELAAPKLKVLNSLRVNGDGRKEAYIELADDATINKIEPGYGTASRSIKIVGGKTIGLAKLYEDSHTLDIFAPDIEYAKIAEYDVSSAERDARHALSSSISSSLRNSHLSSSLMYIDMTGKATANDTAKLKEAVPVVDNYRVKLGRTFSSLFKENPVTQANIWLDERVDKGIPADFTDYFNKVMEYVYQGADTEAKVFALNKKLNGILEKPKLVEKHGKLKAPKRVTETFTETFTEEAETPRYARAQATGFEDELATASELIAKPATVREKVEANLGLAFRTQVLDRLAPLEKVAAEQMDAFKGMQMMYYLRMADQKMSFVQQSVGRGVPQLVEKKRADGKVERLIESQNGPNLVNVVNTLKQAPGMNAQAANQLFTLYLAAKRADRVGYDVLNFGASEANIKSAVAKIEANKELRDVFEKAREQYNDYNRDLVKFLEATGAITPEEATRLAKTNDYIPYYREQNGNAVLVIGGEGTFKVGNLTDQPQLRELIGGNEKILDFLTSSVQNTSMIMDMGLRNQAAKNAMFELADLNMAQFLGGQPSGPDIVRFKDKGVEKFVRVDTAAAGIPADLLVKGMEGIPVNNSAVVKAMGGFSTLLRRSITVSPLYAARQVFRDSVAAPLLSGADFTPVVGALRQIGKSDTREKLESRGIVGGQIFTGTNEDLTRILGELQSGKMGIGQFIAKAEAIAMEADALTRRAQYDSYIAQGLSEMEATLMSLESMNFNRKGLSPSARFLSTVIPFFNAQLQSLDVLYRAMTGKMPMNERLDIQGKLLRRGALLASTAVAYALLMQDDDTYKNANPDEKYNNFFVHVPGIKEAIRVPVPFEIGYIFKSLPEAIVNTMASEQGGEEAYKAFKNIAIQTVPGGTSLFLPAALKPIVEGVSGYSFYTGRQLETKREQMEQAQYRYRDNTSEFAKQIGAATGTSPIKIENLIRGYTGGMGVALTQAFNFAMPTNGTPEQATKHLSDAAVIGPLFQPEDAGGVVGAVYDRVQTLTETKRTYDSLVKSGQRAEAMEFLQRNMDDYAKSAIAGNVQQQLAKVTQAVNAVKASSMSPDEKRESLDRLQKLRIALASSVRGAL